MGMSYRRAWLLVNAMNRCWRSPLVHTSPGRAEGCGARLTELGEQVLARYRALLERLDDAAHGDDHDALLRQLLPEPQASRKA